MNRGKWLGYMLIVVSCSMAGCTVGNNQVKDKQAEEMQVSEPLQEQAEEVSKTEDTEDMQNDIKTKEAMNKILDDLCSEDKINGLTYRIESGDGRFSWSHASGEMKVDTSYALASITKMYTTAVIMKLVDEGKVALDDKIDQYLSEEIIDGLHIFEGVDYSHELTVRHLITHTSGLPDYFTEDAGDKENIEDYSAKTADIYYDFNEIIDRTKSIEPYFAPGTPGRAHYSDGNFQLLGKIIEKITQSSLEAAYEQYIFIPLDIQNTYLFEKDMEWGDIQLLQSGSEVRGRPLVNASERSTGGMVSNTEDNMIFLKAFFAGQLFDKGYLEEMKQFNNRIQFGPIGYGIGLMQCAWKYNLIGHTGSVGSVALYDEVDDLYIVGSLNNLQTKQAIDVAYELISSYRSNQND